MRGEMKKQVQATNKEGASPRDSPISLFVRSSPDSRKPAYLQRCAVCHFGLEKAGLILWCESSISYQMNSRSNLVNVAWHRLLAP